MSQTFQTYLQYLVDQALLADDINNVNQKTYIHELIIAKRIKPNLRQYRKTPYEGYWVSKAGDVYSERRGIILAPRWDKDGYREVTLMDGDNTVSKTVHRLVADAWIPNPKHLPIVNHKNGNRDDNRVSNLEWISVSENNMKKNQNNGRIYVYNGHRIDRKKSKLI